jgi:alkyl hydroperoxide reductase subunit F
MYDLVIIGGGPAGVGAGVYAARKKIKTLLITEDFGGQSMFSPDISNWIGNKSLTGLELAKMLEDHLNNYKDDIDIWKGDLVAKVAKKGKGFSISTKKGKKVEARTILICSGSRRRRLGVPGEDELDGKGLAWCATCDAPMFKDKVVAIIGGGNAGLEAALTLDAYASKLYLLQRRDELKGDAVTQEKIKSLKKLTIIYNALTQEILGDEFVSGLRYKDAKTGKEEALELQGVFVEIGSVPNVDFIKDLVDLDDWNEIIVDHKTQQSSQKGVWAAGDVSDVLYKQNNVSVGDAIKAVLNIFDYLHKNNA